MNYTRNMRQKATYWPPLTSDGFGGLTYGEPVVIACRWQDKADLFRNNEGREMTSSSVVYTDRPLQVTGMIAEGEFTASNPVESAKEIRQKGRSPNLRNTVELNKVWL